jgi:hypothetical protein
MFWGFRREVRAPPAGAPGPCTDAPNTSGSPRDSRSNGSRIPIEQTPLLVLLAMAGGLPQGELLQSMQQRRGGGACRIRRRGVVQVAGQPVHEPSCRAWGP